MVPFTERHDHEDIYLGEGAHSSHALLIHFKQNMFLRLAQFKMVITSTISTVHQFLVLIFMIIKPEI